MPTKRFGGDDPLEVRNENALHEFDQQVYGALPNIPDSGRIVARPIDVYAVRPDIQQPRRILPMVVRDDWNGDPKHVPIVLGRWLEHTQHRIGMKLPMKQVLLGEWENTLTDAQKNEPIVWSFFDIVGLAVTIAQIGQREAVEYAEGVLIDGERRWWATHMLNTWAGKVDGRDFTKILAAEKAKPDVWAQATRNGARTQLNGIEMARQVALLIMAMYEGDPGVQFSSFKELVLPGGIDRAFYAQVGNGNVYRIKRGMTEKVMAATGLKSDSAVRNHRGLLNIPDALWVQADEQNWSEWQIREYLDAMNASNANVTQLHSVTDVTVSTLDQPAAERNDIPQTVRVRGVSGLYVDQPVQKQTSPPPPFRKEERGEKQTALVRAQYDDEFDDVDEDDSEEWRDERPAGPRESMVPVAQSWGEGRRINTVLAMLKSLVRGNDPKNEKLRALLIELATMAPENIRQQQEGTAEVFWRDYLNDAGSRLSGLIEEGVIGELLAYLQHLSELGYEIRERNL